MHNPNPYRVEAPRIGAFKLKWNNSTDRYISIQTGDHARLLLAELSQCEPGQRGSIGLKELRENRALQYEGYNWENKQSSLHPEWDVEVEIHAMGLLYSVRKKFRVSVSDVHPRGSLNITPLD